MNQFHNTISSFNQEDTWIKMILFVQISYPFVSFILYEIDSHDIICMIIWRHNKERGADRLGVQK